MTIISKKPDILKISYENYMKQRMDDTRRDVLPVDVVGQMQEAWKSEIAKLYNLLLGELSDKEREKLRLDQKEWEKKVNTEPKEKKLEEKNKTEKLAEAVREITGKSDWALEEDFDSEEIESNKDNDSNNSDDSSDNNGSSENGKNEDNKNNDSSNETGNKKKKKNNFKLPSFME